MQLDNDRLARIGEFVEHRLENVARQYPSPEHDAAYRWEHTLRVSQYGKEIAQREGANVPVVIAACLLHDVAHFDPLEHHKDHGRLGAQISRPLLAGLGYPAEDVDNICYSIAVHVDGRAGYEHAATLESKIVSDSDNIDRFGAFRILQWCVPVMADHAKLVDKLSRRLRKCEEYRRENPLETATGRDYFARQLDLQISCCKALVAEGHLTTLPQV